MEYYSYTATAPSITSLLDRSDSEFWRTEILNLTLNSQCSTLHFDLIEIEFGLELVRVNLLHYIINFVFVFYIYFYFSLNLFSLS